VPEFSLDLTEEQRELRDWTHGFAAGTVRPAAADWDAREETPWPLIQEAAKIGLYGFEFLATLRKDEQHSSIPVVVLTSKDLTPLERSQLAGTVERIVQKGAYSRAALLREVKQIVELCAKGKTPESFDCPPETAMSKSLDAVATDAKE